MRTRALGILVFLVVAWFGAEASADVALRHVPHGESTHLAVGNTSEARDGNVRLFRAESLWDGKLWSAWACDDLADAWVEIEFPVVRYVTEIQIVGGNAATADRWKRTARPRRLRIVYDGGVRMVTLDDSRSLQTIGFLNDPIVSARLRLEVVDTYGTGPIAISEIKIYEPEDVFALKPALREEVNRAYEALSNPQGRARAIERLASAGPPAIPWLLRGLKGNAKVRAAVAEVFLRTRHKDVVPVTAALRRVLDAPGTAQNADEQAFVRIALEFVAEQRAPEGVQAALALYADDQWRGVVLHQIVKVLAASGHPSGLDALRSISRGDDDKAAELAVVGFGRLGDPGAAAVLSMASDAREHVRVRAAKALVGFTEGRGAGAASVLVIDQSVPVRLEAYRSFTRNPLATWVSYLDGGLTDEDPDVRAAAVSAAGSYSGEGAISRVSRATYDRSRAVRYAAVRSLERLGESALPALVALVPSDANLHDDVRREVRRAIVRQGPRHSERLVELLRDALRTDHRADAQAAAHLLAACGEPGAVVLMQEIQAESARTSFYARRALESRPAYAMAFIRERLSQDAGSLEPRFISHMLAVLTAASDPSTVDLFAALMKDDRDRVRADATAALGRLPGDAVTELLLSALDDPWRDVREHAITGLGTRKEVRAVPRLIEVVRGADPVMLRAIWALGEIADPSAVSVLHGLRDHERNTVRQYVCKALGNIGQLDSLIVLIELVDDEDELVRFHAVRAVEAIE
jgi:HEAT repeat protein